MKIAELVVWGSRTTAIAVIAVDLSKPSKSIVIETKVSAREKQYLEGRNARLAGLSVKTCPYPDGIGRLSWLAGWAEAQISIPD